MRRTLIIILSVIMMAGTIPAPAQRSHKGKPSRQKTSAVKTVGKANTKATTAKNASAKDEVNAGEDEDTLTLSEDFLEATQRIIFIDSLVCDSATYIQHIRLDPSCGRLLYAKDLPAGIAANAVGTAYINGFGDRIIFPQKQPDGTVRLASSDLFGTQWSRPKRLKGVSDSAKYEGSPFIMADGITLYFRRDSSIFLTRYSSDDQEFLSPENIGLPFNYPAANLLLCIDEVNQLGWFVSNRHQPRGKVCIYIFIPTDTRETYSDSLSRGRLMSLAAIHSIAATQTGHATEVKDAREHLSSVIKAANATNAKSKESSVADLQFDVANGVTYHKIEDFHNQQARKLAGDWVVQTFRRSQLADLLSENRNKYGASTSAAEKKALTPIILRQEHELETLDTLLKEMANKIRSLEIR